MKTKSLRIIVAAATVCVNSGCLSISPIRDEHGRIIAKHYDVDWGKTAAVGSLMFTGVFANGFLAAGSVNDETKLRAVSSALNVGKTAFASGGETSADLPHGYMEKERKVLAAIEDPNIFVTYLGLCEDVQPAADLTRTSSLIGTWKGQEVPFLSSFRGYAGKHTIRFTRINEGLLLKWEATGSLRPELFRPWAAWDVKKTFLMGWCPRDTLYRGVFLVTMKIGEKLEYVEIGEFVAKHDGQDSWQYCSESLNTEGMFISQSHCDVVKKNTITRFGASNFQEVSGKFTRVAE